MVYRVGETRLDYDCPLGPWDQATQGKDESGKMQPKGMMRADWATQQGSDEGGFRHLTTGRKMKIVGVVIVANLRPSPHSP
jgi:hypothetical protein